MIREVLATGDISFIRVVDSADTVLAEAGDLPQRPVVHQTELDLSQGNSFEQVLAVEVAGQPFGRIEFGVDTQPLQALVSGSRNWSLGLSLIEMLLVGVFSLVLGGYLTRHLLKLRDASRQLADGNYQVRMEVQGDDELAETARAFNVMAERLQSHHGELERAVHERTAALEAALHQLEDRHQALSQSTRELEAAKLAAEQASLAKSQFLATISHEIRTPINGVQGSLQVMMAEPLNEKARHYGALALSSNDLLMRIISDVLDFSKIEAGHLALNPVPTPLIDVSDHVFKLLETIPRDAGVRLRLDLDDRLDEMVLVDDTRLRQVLLNLGSNAVKFTHAGVVVLRAEWIRQTHAELELLLSVRDTGIGMSAETLSKLFTPFTQADGSHTRQYGGTGLGLSIAQRLVQAMGSQIEVLSTLGGGSTFQVRLTLPVVARPAESVAAHKQPPQRPLEDLNVLVVDDVPINRLIAKELVVQLGASALEAENGLEAVTLLRDPSQQVDLVLMDLQMPIMDGFEATRVIRSSAEPRLRHLPIVAVTGNVSTEARDAALEAGMDAYLTKPLDVRVLGQLQDIVRGADTKKATV